MKEESLGTSPPLSSALRSVSPAAILVNFVFVLQHPYMKENGSSSCTRAKLIFDILKPLWIISLTDSVNKKVTTSTLAC